MEETKVCIKCGRELPTAMFGKMTKSKDGLQPYCKECKNEYMRARKEKGGIETSFASKIIAPSSMKKVWFKPELAAISNKDLIAELKARGFSGKLSYVYEIDV